MAIDEFERLDEGVGKLLDDVLVGFHPGGLHIERGGRIGPAQGRLGPVHRPHVDQDRGILGLQEPGDRRLGGHAGLNLVLRHGGDEGVAGADWH